MPDSNFDRMLQQARALVAGNKPQEALAYYREALQMDPYNPDVWRETASVCEKMGDLINAIDAYLMCAQVLLSRAQFDDALKIYNLLMSIEGNLPKMRLISSPDQVRAHLLSKKGEIAANVGNIYLQKGMTDEAIKILKSSLDVAASHPGVHTMLGIAYMQKGMDKEAFGEFQEVVRLAPNEAAFAYEKIGEIFIRGGKPPQSTIVWFRNAGDLYHRHEQLNDAVRAFETILGFEPKNKDVLLRLGEIYTQLGMKDRAFNIYKQLAQVYTEENMPDKVIGLYEKLVDLNPEDPQTVERLLEVYRGILQRDPSNLGVRSKLVRHLLKQGMIQETVPEYLQLAQSYLEKGLFDDGLQTTQKTLELDPRNVRAREILAEVYIRKGDRDAALNEYLTVWKLLKEAGDERAAAEFNEKLKSIFPEQAELRYQSCLNYRDQGNLPQALHEIEAVLRDRPDDIDALLIQADLLCQLNRWEEAVTVFTRVLALDPGRSDIRRRLADYYFSRGMLEQAVAEVRALTDVLVQQGRNVEAEMLFRKVLAYYPDSMEIRSHLASLKAAMQEREKAVRECLLLANLFVQQKLVDHALATLQKILEFEPDNLNARHRMARMARAPGAPDGAAKQALAQFAYLTTFYSSRNLPKQALKCLEEILEIDPDSLEHRHMLIDLLVKQLRIEEATEQYKVLLRRHIRDQHQEDAARAVQEILALQPLHTDLRMELSQIYLEANYLAEGLALLEDLIKIYAEKKQTSRVIGVYGRMAEVLAQQRKWDEHWDVREKIADLYEEDGKPESSLAEYQQVFEGLLRHGMTERAGRAFDRLSGLHRQQNNMDALVETLQALAERLTSEGRSSEALMVRDRVVDLLVEEGATQTALQMLTDVADHYEETGRTEDAVKARQRVKDLLLKTGQTEAAVEESFRVIAMFLSHGQLSETQQTFSELLTYASDPQAQELRLADMLFRQRRYEHALPLYLKAGEQQETPEGVARIGLIYAVQDKMPEFMQFANRIFATGLLGWVIEEFKTAIGYRQGDGRTHMRLGAFYEAMGFSEDAIGEYQRATRDSATMLAAYHMIAQCFTKLGMLDLACRTLKRVLDKLPEDETMDTRYMLGDLYEKAGDMEKALSFFQDVWATDISYQDVSDRISNLENLIARGTGGGSGGSILPFERPPEDSE